MVVSPLVKGPTADRINTSLDVMPEKFVLASKLYPHVLVASTVGLPLAEAGSEAAPFTMLVDVKARIYNLYPTTSVETTVTVPEAEPSVPMLLGLIGIVIAPLVLMVSCVSPPYGTLAL